VLINWSVATRRVVQKVSIMKKRTRALFLKVITFFQIFSLIFQPLSLLSLLVLDPVVARAQDEVVLEEQISVEPMAEANVQAESVVDEDAEEIIEHEDADDDLIDIEEDLEEESEEESEEIPEEILPVADEEEPSEDDASAEADLELSIPEPTLTLIPTPMPTESVAESKEDNSLMLGDFMFSLNSEGAGEYTISGTSGIWTSTSNNNIVSGRNTNYIKWPTSGNQSGLRFTGVSSFNFNEEQTFSLGKLEHFNYPVSSAITKATLSVDINISNPNLGTKTFEFEMLIDETDNVAGRCPSWHTYGHPACDDKITFPTSYAKQTFDMGGKKYTLEITGFINSSGTKVNEFITEESKTNEATLVGKLTSVDSEVAICHATGDESNPYQKITGVDANATVGDHDSDNGDAWYPGITGTWGDIIPRFLYFDGSGNIQAYEGKNNDEYGLSLLANNCELPSGEIEVKKVTVPEGNNTSFGVTGTGVASISNSPVTFIDGNTGTISATESKTFKVYPGKYSFTETLPSGWIQTGNTCNNIEIENDDEKSCTITNTLQHGTLTLVKKVVNNNGGQSLASAWTLSAIGSEENLSGKGTQDQNENKAVLELKNVKAGTYTLSEAGPAGYGASDWSCKDDDTGNDVAHPVTLAGGQKVTCAITNDDIQPKLTVTKIVEGGNKNVSDFKLYVGNTEVTSGQQTGFNAGTYTVREDTDLDYKSVIGDDCASNGSITLAPGDVKECTITNTRKTGQVSFTKNVTYGDAQPSNWSFAVYKEGVLVGTYDHNSSVALATGVYTVQEVGSTSSLPYYLDSIGGTACSGTVLSGVAQLTVTESGGTCIFGNSKKPQLTVIKVVEPTDSTDIFGFTITESDEDISEFTLGHSEPKTVDVMPGSYTITETGATGYSTKIECTDDLIPTFATARTISLNATENKFCKFTNTKLGSISGTKWNDINGDGIKDEGEEAVEGVQICIDANANSVCNEGEVSVATDASGSYTFSNLLPGSYTIIETLNSGWEQTYPAGSHTVVLSAGEVETDHNFGNWKLKPGINVVKKSTTEFVTDAGQVVPYTFTVTNIGNQILTGITVLDLNCDVAPAYQSGDTNEDSELNLNETWIYTCSHTVTQDEVDVGGELHNKVTVDSSESEPEEDEKDIPITQSPKLSIEKTGVFDDGTDGITNPGDLITYTFKVTNTGNLTLTGITVTDPLLGGAITSCSATVLAVGADMTCTATYAITQADIDAGKVDNTAIADSEESEEAKDDETVELEQSPELSIVKTANPITYNKVGDKISYSYVVTNTGNVTLKGPFTVTDDKTDTSCPEPESLAPNGSITCGATYTITQADLESQSVTNIAFASNDKVTSDKDSATVTSVAGKIIIEKQTLPDGSAESFEFNPTWSESNFNLTDGEKNESGWLAAGTYSVSEIVPSGWQLTDIECDSENTTSTVGYNTNSANITLGNSDIVTCVFTNSKKGTLTVIKDDNIDSGQEFTFYALQGGAQRETRFTLSDDGSNNAEKNSKTFVGLVSIPYKVREVVPTGWSASLVSCTSNNPMPNPDNSLGTGEMSISLRPGENIICTFINTRDTGSIKVNKYTDINGDGDWNDRNEKDNSNANKLGFRWSIDGGDENKMGDKVSGIHTGTYSITESMPDGYHFVSWYYTKENGKSCTNPNGTTFPSSLDVTKGNTTEITMCNVRDTGTVTIIKNSVNESGQDFYFKTDFPSGGFFLEDDGRDNHGTPNQRTFTLPTGEYYVDEREYTGWQLTDLDCEGDAESVVDLATGRVDINLQANEEITCTFTNTQLAKIWGYKYNDKNGNGSWNLGEWGLGNWRIFLDENGNGIYNKPEASTLTSNFPLLLTLGYYQFDNLLPGDYTVCETQKAGWSNTSPLCRTITLKPGEIANVNFFNIQYGQLSVHKYYDQNGDGLLDEGEQGLEGWEMNVYKGNNCWGEPMASDLTNDHGYAVFENLVPGQYSVKETLEDGWETTSDVCTTIKVDPASHKTVDIGNRLIDSQLMIEKTNDAWPNDQEIGDEVTYTIKLMATDGPVYDVSLFDLPPHAFSYVAGSYTADSSIAGDLSLSEPNYASPGEWQLGDLAKDEIVTVSYKAIIGDEADAGIYPDAAWATGTSAEAQYFGKKADLLALSDPDFKADNGEVAFLGEQGHYGEEHFVGTRVAVVTDETPSAKYKVEKIKEKEGAVLGAILPATGANFWLSLLAIISILTGTGLLLVPNRKRRQGKVLMMLLMLGLGLLMAKPVQALTSVRLAQPYNSSAELDQDAITNQDEFRIDFVILNTDGASLTAQCQQQEDGGAWTNIDTVYTAKAGGNSGYCEAKDLANSSQYAFRVLTSDGEESQSVKVGLETDRPKKPVSYEKHEISSCKYEIKFKTADDGRTSKVEVYRSDDNVSFTAKASSRIKTITIGSDEKHSFETTRPDCDKDYYYAIRAFDQYGNASDLVGDREVKTVIVEGTEAEEAGALAVTETVVLDGDVGDAGVLSEGLLGEEVAEDEKGTILGIDTESLVSFLTKVALPILVFVTIAILVYRLVIAKRNEK